MTEVEAPRSPWPYRIAVSIAIVLLVATILFRFSYPYYSQQRILDELEKNVDFHTSADGEYWASSGYWHWKKRLLDAIPKHGGFRKIDGLKIYGGKRGTRDLTEDDLRLLAQLPFLSRLELYSVLLPETGLAALGSAIKRLKVLEIENTNFNDSMVADLPEFAGLVTLSIVDNPKLSESGMVGFLEKTPDVQFLSLETDIELGTRLIDSLVDRTPNLIYLALICESFDAVLLEKLAALRHLVFLDLSIKDFGDDDAAHLSGLTNLRGLDLSETSITSEGFKHLENLKNLEIFEFSCAIDDRSVGFFRNLPRLEILDLSGTEIADAGLPPLVGCTSLKLLNLSETAVTDAGIEHLKKMTGLEELNVKQTEITEDGLEELMDALPDCKINPISYSAFMP